jgi:hypothetical protein
MEGLPRTMAALAAGVVAFVGAFYYLMPAGCDDVGGVPSWERCTSLEGTPAFSLSDLGLPNQFDILIPLFAFALVASITWLLLGATDSDQSGSKT